MWSHQEDEVKALEGVLSERYHKEEGPFVKALDKALASFNVQRQAYYSGTFVGNHVHRTLKVQIHWCNSLFQTLYYYCSCATLTLCVTLYLTSLRIIALPF